MYKYKNKQKRTIKSLFSKEFLLSLKDKLSYFWNIYALKSYSQEGEDMILRRIFENVETGFYIDVGAHHPKRFSNTYFFYKKGWSGINIDATPGSMKLFNKLRPRDINIETAIAKQEGDLTFFMFNDPALNTCNEELSKSRNSNIYHIVQKINVKTKTFENVLLHYLPKEQTIDFLSIDVEGLDMEVLESNDWDLFRPKCILVEQSNSDIDKIKKNKVYIFMHDHKYELFAKTFNTLIFKDYSFVVRNVST